MPVSLVCALIKIPAGFFKCVHSRPVLSAPTSQVALVYDVGDGRSFDHLDNWRGEFLRQVGLEENGANFPFVLLGNKIDRPAGERQVTRQRAAQWCEGAGLGGQMGGPIPHFETSAKTADNVEAAFLELATLAVIHAERNRKEEPVLSFAPTYRPHERVDLRRQGSSSYNYANGGNDCC